MQRIHPGVALPLGQVELRSQKGLQGGRVNEPGLHFWLGQAWELTERRGAPFSGEPGESRKVGKVKKRRRRCELLFLEEHRRARPQQQQGGERFIEARAGEGVTAQPKARVGNLVVILEKGDKRRRREVQGWGAAPLLLPFIVLSLVQVAILEGGDEFLRRAQIIRVIGFLASGHGDHGAVVEVVVPEHVQAIATLLRGPDQLRVLGFVLIDQQGGAPTGRLPHLAGDRRQDVVR